MNPDWQITPHEGVGRLSFGLTPDAVASMASLYGKAGPLMAQASFAAEIKNIIEQSDPELSSETIAAMRRAAQDLVNFSTQNLTLAGTPILLEYRDGLLHGVTVEAAHEEAHFLDQPVFQLGALAVIRLFEQANGAPGRFRSSEAAFDHIGVSLYQFSSVSGQGQVLAMPASAPEFRERSITLRREPYRPADELNQFVNHSFLE